MLKKIVIVILVFSHIKLFSSESVKLTFAGDIMAHDVNYRTVPLSDIYSGVSEYLLNDDLTFGNLEYPIDETRKQSSYPSFNVHPSYIEAAIIGGFDVFSLGNNHTNDFGLKSVEKTISNMNIFKNKHYISYSGVFKKNETGFKVESIQIKDLNIGFISVTQFSNNYWNKEGAAKIYTVDYLKREESENFISFINSVKDKYDCLILSYHGGVEYRALPSNERVLFFDKLIDAGVDILWAHHPHVLQPWKFSSSEVGDKLILYSMGNFISGQLAIVDPINNDVNFAATGFSALFNVDLTLENGVLRINNPEPRMIANIRNHNKFFVAVKKEDALKADMSEDWKNFYIKMFPVAEYRIRKQ